jgi:acyl-coenzyme A thioesterase PaaI-like protein
MSINFLRPAKAGDVIRGVAEVVKHGQTQAYIETRLERAMDGAVLTKATATNVFLRG